MNDSLRRLSASEFARRLRATTRLPDHRFALFIGAGCSTSSGIPASNSLVRENWLPRLRDLRAPDRRDLEQWAKEIFPCYAPEGPAGIYGELMKELFLHPADRQREIETLCEGHFPGFAYGCLAALMALDGGLFNVALTTNFDDLLADALYLFTSVRPLVIHHESLAPFIRPTRTRPLIVKLHGDHRLSPLNTQEETEAIRGEIEANVRAILHDRGLVFIGYGGNDRGIRTLLEGLPSEALPLGVFWVARREPTGVIRPWLDSRQAAWVQCDDFDELMLYIRDDFRLPQPQRERLENVFDQYLDDYHLLSNRIIMKSDSGSQELELARIVRRISSLPTMSRPRLFGRDGIKGVVGRWPIDPVTLWKLGRAFVSVLTKNHQTNSGKFVIGWDTRESSREIARSFTAGILSAGGTAEYAGVMTTPGIAFLTASAGFSGGIMVSASHSVHSYNGLKLFCSGGMRLSEESEAEIEREVSEYYFPLNLNSDGSLKADPSLRAAYRDKLCSALIPAAGFSKIRIVVDCANGSTFELAKEILGDCGVLADFLFDEPDGWNINLGCGSLHPEAMAERTKSLGADFGVAFDGDGDRVIFATRNGEIINGDQILFVIACHWKQQGILRDSQIVGTTMTNLGVELSLNQQGISVRRTHVGDKYVLASMLKYGCNLGGESSGNIIFSDVLPSGDGLLCLLQILKILDQSGKGFCELFRNLSPFPQVTLDVPVRETRPLESFPSVNQAIALARRELGDRGRIVVRYSQTEPLARVTVEAESPVGLSKHAERIATAIENAIGISREPSASADSVPPSR